MSRFARRFVSARLVGIGSAAAIALSIHFLAVADAQAERMERELTGHGADHEAAVLNALQEATFQICGVRIRARLDLESEYVEDDSGERMTDRINRGIQASTQEPVCEIDSYEVLDISGDGARTRAKLRVRYTVYQVPGPPMERRRIAVLDFPMEEVHLYGTGGGREKRGDGETDRIGIDVDLEIVKNLQDEFRANIEALLTQGRRFGVLDRKRPEVYETEKRLLESSDAGPGERARLGKVMGADYLLYGTIDRVIVEDQTKTIRITGERRDRLVSSAKVRFTILATATRQVKWSSAIALDRVSPAPLRPEVAAEALLNDIAAAMVDELTENIYPPRVTKLLAPGRFVVNRGGSTVATGDLFEVFAVGDWLIDPDTGEKLDQIETSVGIARVVAVKPKYSLAEIISEGVDLSRGMVLRRRGIAAEGGGGRHGDPPVDRQPSFQDDDGDGLPDYLNRL